MARTKEFNEDQVLEKAIEIFWYKGYNGTSAQDLVTHLGLSRSSLYDTFGDKQKLFTKALCKYHDENYQRVKEELENAVNVKEALIQIFKQAVIESLEDRITKGCFLLNSAIELAVHDNQIAEIVNNNRKMMERVFYNAVKKGQESGQISTQQDALLLARFIANNYSGIRVLGRGGEKDKQVYDDIIKVTFSIF
ncbi:TetR/AcrR family transcriptional regulator [Flavobacterium johnsoniae]|uniref:Transcriptional regulator, TetR family n=1 Tax=Flavobacterium johnsoniae TaxID=986 RepID=A0A1M5JFN7_FLAJO|nr:TetR/AcrR family transcriptional regulator [Flavobacterium johnsoniae]SHG39099.1 transcriptional regulator, TetR family [Flavobacterium johnsoniae]